MSKEQETLDNFEGFENVADIDFFGEKPVEENSAEQVMKELEKEDALETGKNNIPVTDIKEKEKEEEAEKPEINFFDEAEIEEEVETEDKSKPSTKSKKEDTVQVSSKALLSKLKEKGIVDFELEEGEELTDELADELVEDGFDNAVEKSIGEKMKDLPDSVKNIVKYAINGGNVDELFAKMRTEPTIKLTKDLDLDSEDNQKMIIRMEKQAENEDSETTDAYIEFLKESGKLKSVSEKTFEKLIAKKDKLSQAEAARIQKAKEDSKKNERLFKKEMNDFISENDELKGVPITRKNKTSLASYMTEKVKLEDGRTTTKMHQALYNALQDKEKSVILAKILESDFDFSDIAKAEKTKYSKEVKGDLTRSKKTITPNTNDANKKKDFASYFND